MEQQWKDKEENQTEEYSFAQNNILPQKEETVPTAAGTEGKEKTYTRRRMKGELFVAAAQFLICGIVILSVCLLKNYGKEWYDKLMYSYHNIMEQKIDWNELMHYFREGEEPTPSESDLPSEELSQTPTESGETAHEDSQASAVL